MSVLKRYSQIQKKTPGLLKNLGINLRQPLTIVWRELITVIHVSNHHFIYPMATCTIQVLQYWLCLIHHPRCINNIIHVAMFCITKGNFPVRAQAAIPCKEFEKKYHYLHINHTYKTRSYRKHDMYYIFSLQERIIVPGTHNSLFNESPQPCGTRTALGHCCLQVYGLTCCHQIVSSTQIISDCDS